MTDDLQPLIEAHWERRARYTPADAPAELIAALDAVLDALDSGAARVAEPGPTGWRVNEWLKKAVLLYFRTHDNRLMPARYTSFYDKVPLKYAATSDAALRESGVRIVPPAVVRRGAYIGPGVVLMPSYVNIGAWVGANTMVDTWATVGSCAQIGSNVHLSGGVGIGEPNDYRGRLLHRRALGDRRGRGRRQGRGRLDGRVHRRQHQDLRPRERRGAVRARSGRGRGRAG
jgi:2,3,4,5-tetrahydropyridine-2,6-dicarboxylate N-succinyltransferase